MERHIQWVAKSEKKRKDGGDSKKKKREKKAEYKEARTNENSDAGGQDLSELGIKVSEWNGEITFDVSSSF